MPPDPASPPRIGPLRLLFAAALIFLNRILLRLRLRRPRDGWRRGAGLVLRGQAARFVLSAFNLRIPSAAPGSPAQAPQLDQQLIAQKLAAFLQDEPEFHLAIHHSDSADTVIPLPRSGHTLAFHPWVDGPARFMRPDDWTGASAAPPGEPTAFSGASAAPPGEPTAFSGASAAPAGEPAAPPAKLRAPAPAAPAHLPLFQFICRISPAHRADLWVRVNHVGADGVPVQAMLTRLERAWGVDGPIIFPGRAEFAPFESPRPSPGRAQTAEVQAFIDFAPLLAWRKRQNEKLPEPMTFSAALLWRLARHTRFSGIHMGTTVEVPQIDALAGGVGVVVIRPSDYFRRPGGLARYVADFNRELALTRQRKSAGHKTLDAAAFIPPRLEEGLMRHALLQGGRAFGALALTILKDAKVFGAPLADAGHAHGFIAVGGVSFDSADGNRVGCVVIKGPVDAITNHAAAIREAINAAETDDL